VTKKKAFNILRELEPNRYGRSKLHDRIYDEILIPGIDFTAGEAEEYQDNIQLLLKIMEAYSEFSEEAGRIHCMFSEYLQLRNEVTGIGQFFTPSNICDFMTEGVMAAHTKEVLKKRNLDDDRLTAWKREQLDDRGYRLLGMRRPVTILDPASGTGRFMMAMARYYRKHVGTYNFVFTNIDIDRRVWIYGVMNAILNAIPSRHLHGNTLSGECWEAFIVLPTGQWLKADHEAIEKQLKKDLATGLDKWVDTPQTSRRSVQKTSKKEDREGRKKTQPLSQFFKP